MNTRDVMRLLVLGLIIWALGTVYYAYTGPLIFETTAIRYWISFFLSPVISGAICVAVLRRLRVPAANWASAMLLLAIPGMIGEAIVLINWSTFMPRLHTASAGKYAAFLFVTYAVVLSLAVLINLKTALTERYSQP